METRPQLTKTWPSNENTDDTHSIFTVTKNVLESSAQAALCIIHRVPPFSPYLTDPTLTSLASKALWGFIVTKVPATKLSEDNQAQAS